MVKSLYYLKIQEWASCLSRVTEFISLFPLLKKIKVLLETYPSTFKQNLHEAYGEDRYTNLFETWLRDELNCLLNLFCPDR